MGIYPFFLDSKRYLMLNNSITSLPTQANRVLSAGPEPCWYRAGKPAC